MRDRRNGWVVERERDSGNGLDSAHEMSEQSALLNVENIRGKDVAFVVDLDNGQTVGERRNVQHVEKSCLGRSDLITSSNEFDIGNDFNGTTSDFGWDTKSLEERGLAWFHTGVSSGNGDINWSDGTSTSRSSDTVCENLCSDFLEVALGEDESNVAFDVRKETLKSWEFVQESTDRTANHGVFTHENDTFSTERLTDLMHLV